VIGRTSGSIWGTTYELGVIGGDLATAHEIFLEEVELCARVCDRFEPLSELRELSATTGSHRVSDSLGDYLACANLGWNFSQGLVDPLVGNALIDLGYDCDFDLVLSRPLPEHPSTLRWNSDVSYEGYTRTLHVKTPCVIDLGATAKARVVDRIVIRLYQNQLAEGVLASIGGDVMTAGKTAPNGWPITVVESAKSMNRGRTFAEISIYGGGIATSSTAVRSWGDQQTPLHHLIDPRTGLPANSPWQQVSVLANTCFEANVAATAAHLQGGEAPEILAEKGLGALLIDHEMKAIEVGTWPRSPWW
jgi:thiamine biosynthesis lipoprotein